MIQLSDKTIRNIKLIFNITFISIVSFDLLKRAFYSLPNDWLFFFTSDAIENFLCALAAYVIYYFVQKLHINWQKMGFIMLFVFILSALALLKDYRIHDLITSQDTFQYFTSFLGQALLYYGLIYIVNRLDLLNYYKNLENQLNQAKEQLLRNQLHPHFLFNAFNSLYSLSLKNHSETSDYILKLSSIMRYITDEAHIDAVLLSKELGFIKQYIEIEKIRFGNDANIQLTIDEHLNEGKLIAPFLLITLVENAFKHGFYTNSKDAFVNIHVKLNNDELIFNVENKVFNQQHFQPSNRKGKGIENLQQRLQLLYPKKARLKNTISATTYSSELHIILN